MSDFVLGQYVSGNSIIHKSDPRVKIFFSLVVLVCVFLVNSFVCIGLFLAFVLMVIAVAKIPFSSVIRSLRPILFILTISSFFNLFFTNGDNLVFQWNFISIYMEGIITSIRIAMRLSTAIISTTVMMMTTKPIELTDGMEKLMSPLKKLKVPVQEIALMISITLRFIPTLAEEADCIIKAQNSRGADFDTGKFFEKLKAIVSIMIPLFVSAWNRAIDLADAMESRCYGGKTERTRMKNIQITKRDVALLLSVVCFAIVVVLVEKTGII